MNKSNRTEFPELTTERLRLRQLNQHGDAAAVSEIRSSDIVNQYLDRQPEMSVENARAFINTIIMQTDLQRWSYWAICLKNEPALLGTICLWNYSEDRSTADIGYELLPQYHGRGIMDEALKAVIDHGFHQLNLQTILAVTHKDNGPSIRLLERNNFALDPENRSLTPEEAVKLSVFYLDNKAIKKSEEEN